MKRRSGLTLVSIVLYVVLFFAFTTFAILMSSNMNYKVMTEKGNIYVCEQRDKLQANILNSAAQSDWTQVDNTTLTFSNNDKYEYDQEKKVIKKNNGILVKGVEECNFELSVSDIKNINTVNIDNTKQVIALRVKFFKYNQEKECEYIFAIGADNYE